mgnify:CR=1 FL=1
MSRISCTFNELRRNGKKALIPFITGGNPSLEMTKGLIESLAESGCDIIEIGIPYSDPVADGPTLQRAAQRSLANGTNIQDLFDLVADIRGYLDIPIVFLAYYNCIYNYGIKNFAKSASCSGVDGIIVPDLPPEEASFFEEAAWNEGIDTIFLVAPTSTEKRLKLISEHSRGFIYCVSLTGVTGARQSLCSGFEEFMAKVRRFTDKPLCVGFGISTPEMASHVGKIADGIIVGSAIVDMLESSLTSGEGEKESLNKISKFVRSFREELDN